MREARVIFPRAILVGVLGGVWVVGGAEAADQPQWGCAWTRNMICSEKGLPSEFDPGKADPQSGEIDQATTKNVKWVARLGNITYGMPIVGSGRVLIGTNNARPRDSQFTGDRGVLMCFDAKDGRFLWQLNLPKLTRIKWADWFHIGMTSSPTIEGDRAYLVTNRGELICLDLKGMSDGNDGPFREEGRLMAEEGQPPVQPGPQDADILWLLDMPKDLLAEPHNAANGSPMILGDHLYVCTSNGVEWTHKYVVHPEAPSVIVVDKHTGQLIARDDFGIGPDITHGQWSSPAMGEVGGRLVGFFGAGNGVLYAFGILPRETTRPTEKPLLLNPIWKFHGHPLAQTQDHVPADHQHDSTSYQVTANPVFYKNRIYLTFTQEPFHNMKQGWLVCVDATKTGDVTRSAMVWSYDKIGAGVATVAIADGLVYAVGYYGTLHCLDAETGQVYWTHEVGSPATASPLVADGKIYLGTARQTFWILQAGKEKKVLAQIRLPDKVYATATAANGVLYIPTFRFLYAVADQTTLPKTPSQ